MMTALLLLWGSVVLGQSGSFNETEATIKKLVEKGQWDQVLTTAPDLIVLEPSRSEGYYYTALAFGKIGQVDKAREYLTRAESLKNSSSLAPKLRALRMELEEGGAVEQLKMEADRLQKTGRKDQAAQLWKKAWEQNKTNAEYGLNAVELFLDQKKYLAALEILTDPAMPQDGLARQIITRINETPEMRAYNGYIQVMNEALSRLNRQQYRAALEQFDLALAIRPNDADALAGRNKAQDELAWQEATQQNTIEGFEAYVRGNTNRQHRAAAITIITNQLLLNGERAARDNNVERMEYFLKKCLIDYPDSPNAARSKALLCEKYYQWGKALALDRRESSQAQAITYFNNVKSLCPTDYAVDRDLRLATRRRTRLGRGDLAYFTGLSNLGDQFGMSAGSANARKVGMYWAAMANVDIFTEGATYTINNAGQVSGMSAPLRRTGSERNGNAALTIGFTKTVLYPLALYVGGGVVIQQHWVELERFSSRGALVDTEWVKNTDREAYRPAGEAGLMLNWKGAHLRAGLRSVDLKAFAYTVGLGFSWDR